MKFKIKDRVKIVITKKDTDQNIYNNLYGIIIDTGYKVNSFRIKLDERSKKHIEEINSDRFENWKISPSISEWNLKKIYHILSII